MPARKIFVCIPLMDELENLQQLLHCLRIQDYKNFLAVICINQPDQWWDDPEKQVACEHNQQTIRELQKVKDIDVKIIDWSSRGRGWKKKHYGVGWARKVAMDKAAAMATPDDIMVTMDGDTEFGEKYLGSLADAFLHFPKIKAVSVPYYHRLTGREDADRAILRYEVYMRYYAINMLRIENPYAFTALGSAMACTAQAYRTIGGITPHKSGEDFYFMQKLRKSGSVLIDHHEKVYPAARFSDRVFFGTGPAMIKGSAGDWNSYPVYPHHFFDELRESFDQFGDLFHRDVVMPMAPFLEEKFGKNFWQPLCENVTSRDNFMRACIHKVDGLRILQYLKWRNQQESNDNEVSLQKFLNRFYPVEKITALVSGDFKFETASVSELDQIRNFLQQKEEQWQQKIRILR